MNDVLPSLDLLAHLADAVIAVDLEGRVLFWNEGAEKLYGWSFREAVGQAVNDLLKSQFASPPGLVRSLESMIDSLLRDGRWQGELTRTSRSGEPIDVLSRWTILRDQAGASIGRLIIDTDLTEIRLRFHELRLAEERARELSSTGGIRDGFLSALVVDIADQNEAQQLARRAHQQLRNVLDSITDGLCVLDRDWRYIYFNEAGARICGLVPGDIIGRKFAEIIPESQIKAFAEAYYRAIETGQPSHFEGYYGEPLNKWIECHCYPSISGLTVYFRDITERKRTEDALRTSESRYRKLFESDIIGIGIPDRFGGFSDANDELLRISGCTREDLNAGLLRWDAMTPPEYAQIDALHIAEAAQRGSCTPYEKEYIRKDGSRVRILCGYALLEGSENEYIGFVLDISRQFQAEAALREREERFRLLAEGIPQLVWLTDAVGAITYLNQRFLDYVGIPASEMDGFMWPAILHPEEHNQTMRRWMHSVETGEPYIHELRMRSADGSYRYFLARGLAMRNLAGEVERWVGSCTDIHDQKIAEEALRRTEKLAATGRLAASIAHEINNPLEAVTNALYLALRDPTLNPETRRFLQMAEQELARVGQITTQTLRFHRQSKSASNADLSAIMESVLTLFGPRLFARQIVVERRLQAGVSSYCFEDELRQVFANIVSNSIDASVDGSRIWVRIRKSFALTPDRIPGVRVTVADTGCGIPKALHKSIFEPFFTTKDATGLGLGLWVSAGIIRKHRGRLHLRSVAGSTRHGTVMSLFFPAAGADL